MIELLIRLKKILILQIALVILGSGFGFNHVTRASEASKVETFNQSKSASQSIAPEHFPGFTQTDTGISILDSDDRGLVLELITPGYNLTGSTSQSGPCQKLSVYGFGETDNPGWPQLPVKGAMIGIPPHSTPKVTILETELISVAGRLNLCPVPQLIYDLSVDGEIDFQGYQLKGEPLAYTSNSFVPARPVELVSTAFLRSQRVAQLRFQPFQYNPATGELRFHNRIRLRVDYSSDQLSPSPAKFSVDEGPFEAGLENILLNYDQARTWRLPSKGISPLSEALFDPPEPAYKLLVEQDGLYQVSYTDLQNAGLPVDTLDPQTFQLFNQGAEIAIYVPGEGNASFDPSEYLFFYGQGLDTKYTNTNIYWLTWGSEIGLRMAAKDGTLSGIASTPQFFTTTDLLEEDHIYRTNAPSGVEDDHWYWDYLWGVDSPASKNFTTTLTHLASLNATVRGLFDSYVATPQHHTLIYLNGHLIDDTLWAEDTEYNFEIDVSQDYLLEGVNTITVDALLDSGITVNIPYINWFEIDYHRNYTVETDLLAFDGEDPGNWEFQLPGFTTDSLEIYDVTNPISPIRILNAVITPNTGSYSLAFEDTLSGENHYLALSTAQRLSPISIIPDNPSDLQDTNNGADYIIITHPDFYTDMQPLAAHRADEGLRTIIIDVGDIYDEFSDGIFDPNAIHDFLAFAYTNWQSPAPAYVLLVGDGHYDFLDNLGRGEPIYIPPFLADVDPWLGEVPADNQYVCVSGDDPLPDMHLGRLPVKTSTEASDVVDKILDYELVPSPGDWNQQVSFVGDDADAAGDFAAISNGIADNYLPTPYTSQKIYFGVTHDTIPDANNAIINAINEGRLLVNYIGHSNRPNWAQERLLSVDDIPGLEKNVGRLPMMVPMTCLEGAYHYPSSDIKDYSSLAESLLRAVDKGAIASFSPTGFGVATGHDFLNKGLYEAIFSDDIYQVGPATTQAKLYLYSNTGLYRDLLDTYLLFGDPATSLNVLPAEVNLLSLIHI